MNKLFSKHTPTLTIRERIYHIVVFSCFVYLWWGVYYGRHIQHTYEWLQLWAYASTYVVFLSFNIHVLMTRYFFKGKILKYIVLSLLVNVISYCIQQLVYSQGIGSVVARFINEFYVYLKDFGINILVNGMIGSVGLAFVLLHSLVKTQKQISEFENLILKAELETLKTQISPHFLFNTLNNVYVLCKTNPEKAAESILALADITRYQLYEIQQETVQLSQEVRYINELLNLEKLRKDDLIVDFSIDIEKNNCMIQPMLFTPLVENAIKHGSQQLQHCHIDLRLWADTEALRFRIGNSYISPLNNMKAEKKLGLENLARRLQISYPNKHTLSHWMENNMYYAELVLEFV